MIQYNRKSHKKMNGKGTAMFDAKNAADEPKLIELTDFAYVRQEIDNMGWLDLGGVTVIVDALEKEDAAADVLRMLDETVRCDSIRYVCNTHTHYDHTALNPLFENEFGAAIINAGTCCIPAEGRWISGDTRSVQLLPLPDCHTHEDCVVWFPDAATLFIGDIFGWGLIPRGRMTADIAGHISETYRRLIVFDADHVVPGHGPLCGTTELQRWLEYFEWLPGAVRSAAAESDDKDAVLAAVPVPDDMSDWWRFRAWKHENNVDKVYRAVQAGRL